MTAAPSFHPTLSIACQGFHKAAPRAVDAATEGLDTERDWTSSMPDLTLPRLRTLPIRGDRA